jgi:hypothetical protein
MCITTVSVAQTLVSVQGPELGIIQEFVFRYRKQARIVRVPAQIRSSPFSNIIKND